jgi:hypothetical protein
VPKKRKRPRKPATHGRDGRRQPDFMQQIWTALRGDPLDLLGLASNVLAFVDPREKGPLRDAEQRDQADLVEILLDVERIETTALLTAVAAMCGDEVMATRIRRELAVRTHPLPAWLTDLDGAVAVDRAVVTTEPLNDGEDVLVGVTLPDGSEFAAVVFIEHNAGSVVKDAFVLPGSLDQVLGQMELIFNDPDIEFVDLDPADARIRITQAITHGAMIMPPFESDTWPASRRLIEWMVAMLPEGGRGYEFTEWSEDEKQALADRFLASEVGSGFDDALHREMLDHLLWFGTGYGPGDPLRWSSIAVEIVLLDWLPRKIADTAEHLAVIPDLLRAFVRYSHAERGIRPGLTDEVLAMIDALEPEYREIIASPRLQGPMALLERMGALSPEAAADMLFDPDDELDSDSSQDR